MLQRVLGGPLQPHDSLRVLENLHPVEVVDLLFDFLLHTGLYLLTAEEVDSYEEV